LSVVRSIGYKMLQILADVKTPSLKPMLDLSI
jgi:hypothetical protein